jgi:serine phosphatase RsbU (regulator of sigma subunit)
MIKYTKPSLHEQSSTFFSSPIKVRILFVIAILFVLLVGATNFYSTISQVTDENFFRDDAKGVTVIAVAKGGASDRAGMKVGDVIVRINGKTFSNAYEADRIMRAGGAGNVVEYVVLRDGKEVTLQVVLASFGINIVILILFLTGILGLATAALIGLLRPHLKEARLLFTTFLFWSLLLLGIKFRTSYYLVIMFFSIPITVMLFFYTGFHFPVLRQDILNRRWLIRAFIGFAFVLSLALATRGIMILTEKVVSRFIFLGLIHGSYLLLIIAGIAILIAHRKSKPLDAKRFGRYTKWSGYLIGVAFFVATALATIKDTSWIVYGQYAFFSLMLLPVAYLYTIHRFKLLEYHPILRRSRVYLVVAALINLLFVAILVVGVITLPKLQINYPGIWFTERSIEIGFLNNLPSEQREHWQIKTMIVTSILFVLILWRLRGFLQKVIARKFYQEKYDYKKALAEFRGIIACCLDLNHLTKEVVYKLSNLMLLKNIGIALAHNGRVEPAESVGFNHEKWQNVHFQTNASWLKNLTLEGIPRVIDNIDPQDKEVLKNLGASIIAPITINGRLLGLFILGEKLSEDYYRVEDIELLESAARQTAVALENVSLYKELQEQDRLKSELQLAHRIQIGSLPKQVPVMAGLDIFATSRPALEVGGDYYDFFQFNQRQIMSIVGDVSGKGTSAALYVAKIQGIMRAVYEYHPSPADLFVKVNELLSKEIEKNFFITQIGVKIDLRKKKATIVRAGHVPVIYFNSKTDTLQSIESRGLGLCISDPAEFKSQLEEIKIPFRAGDIFVIYSDGLTDIQNQNAEDFGEHRLVDAIRKVTSHTADQIGRTIINTAETFAAGGKRFDDMTVCVLKIETVQ